MFDMVTIVKAMADENRLRIIMALRGKELCVCTLSGLLDLAPSTTSRHLSILKQARLIESVKDGKFVYYRLAMPDSKHSAPAASALIWLVESLKESQQVLADESILKEIINRGEQVAADAVVADAGHKLYRHVPGIHAIGDFGERRTTGLSARRAREDRT